MINPEDYLLKVGNIKYFPPWAPPKTSGEGSRKNLIPQCKGRINQA